MMQIRESNLIPVDFIRRRNYDDACFGIKRFFKLGILVLLGFSVTVGAYMYYIQNSRDQDVPEKIKTEYSKAQQDLIVLQKKEQMDKKVIEEDVNTLPILETLIQTKPSDIRLTKIEISANVLVEGFMRDPSACNQYVQALNSQSTVNKAIIERLTNVGLTDMKSFGIRTNKGK